jgi:hypothetical protein
VKLKLSIALVSFLPTIVLAQASLPSAQVSSTGKSAGIPSAPTPQTVQNTVKAVETVSDAKQNTPSNTAIPAPTYSSGKTNSKKSSDPTSVGIEGSDQRLKRDITPIAVASNGIQLYSFKYLWSDEVYVGVMAQDLLSNPQWKDAVLTSNTGYYKVDYSKLGLQMMTLGQYELQQKQTNIALAN